MSFPVLLEAVVCSDGLGIQLRFDQPVQFNFQSSDSPTVLVSSWNLDEKPLQFVGGYDNDIISFFCPSLIWAGTTAAVQILEDGRIRSVDEANDPAEPVSMIMVNNSSMERCPPTGGDGELKEDTNCHDFNRLNCERSIRSQR